MKRKLTKLMAALTVVTVMTGSMSSVAFAHHSEKREAAQTAVCYEDGSCDVSGVCRNGTDCDRTSHHTGMQTDSGSNHDSEKSHKSGHRSGSHH